MNSIDPIRIDRRLAIKWMLAASAGAVLVGGRGLASAAGGARPHLGYGLDPDLLKEARPGDFWPLVLTQAQRRAVGILGDIVIPADPPWPSASSVGIVDFVDEWVSAPYPEHLQARKIVLSGFEWLDQRSVQLYAALFADATAEARLNLCEELARKGPSGAAEGSPQAFFKFFRNLVAGGYYTSSTGMRDIGYVGNVPLPKFEGPPAELLAKLGLAGEGSS